MSISEQLPSQQQVWTKHYAAGTAEQLEHALPEGTLWNLIERAMRDDLDCHDAIRYFGRRISRSQLIDQVDRYARMMKAMGVRADEQVLLFCPMIPEAVAILFAANKIGATVIMPNLAASHRALEGSVDKSVVAFVYDGMEPQLGEILSSSQIRQVVLLSATSSMVWPLNRLLGMANRWKTRRSFRTRKYMTLGQALRRYVRYDGRVEAAYRADRISMVFSSGGTTQEGTAKQICMTDCAMISMFRCALGFNLNGNPFREGSTSLAMLPPFVCTGLFVLVLAPLYRGMTVHMDPRLEQDTFNKAVLRHRPQITLVTGSMWAGFFRKVEADMKAGKQVDLSHFVLPFMGGEGCTPEALQWMDELLHRCGSATGLVSGYGMSEAFSVITIDYFPGQEKDYHRRMAVSVGYPFPGSTVGIFDDEGHELPYGQRGELWARTPSMTEGYLNNHDLTRKMLADGWIHSGDLAEMDEEGMVYVYGRMYEHITAPDGERIYLFDLANLLRQDAAVKESLVTLVGDFAQQHIVAHLILNDDATEQPSQVLQRLDAAMSAVLPQGVAIAGYQIHQGHFQMSLVGKVNRNYYSRLLTGYVKPEEGVLREVSFNK